MGENLPNHGNGGRLLGRPAGLIAISKIVSVAGSIIYQAHRSPRVLLFPVLFQKFGAERSVQVAYHVTEDSQDNPIALSALLGALSIFAGARDDRTFGS